MQDTASTVTQRPPNLFRRLYAWTIQWADRPGGTRALFIIAFIESSFFPIPPDVLLIALCIGASAKAFRFALVCSAGSVLGGILGYGIGLYGYDLIGAPIVRAYHGEAVMQKIKDWYDTYGFWGNLAAAITPIPYKVFTIASGVFHFDFASFLTASVLGRSLRFFAVGAVIFWVGPTAKRFIEEYFEWLAIAGTVLLIGGFALLKYLR